MTEDPTPNGETAPSDPDLSMSPSANNDQATPQLSVNLSSQEDRPKPFDRVVAFCERWMPRILPPVFVRYFFPEKLTADDGEVRGEFKNVDRALAYAMDERKLEIDIYWKRNAFFWTLIAGAMVGFLGLSTPGKVEPAFLEMRLIVACLGLVFSYSWMLVNVGSGYWQETWWRLIQALEEDEIGPLHSVRLERTSVSATWVNKILSAYVTVVWFVLAYHAFSSAGLTFHLSWTPDIGGAIAGASGFAIMSMTVLAFRRRDSHRVLARARRRFRAERRAPASGRQADLPVVPDARSPEPSLKEDPVLEGQAVEL